MLATLVIKARHLSTKRRHLILCDGTAGCRLIYVHPASMELKGAIPWSPQLHAELMPHGHFRVHTPGRTYYLQAPTHPHLRPRPPTSHALALPLPSGRPCALTSGIGGRMRPATKPRLSSGCEPSRGFRHEQRPFRRDGAARRRAARGLARARRPHAPRAAPHHNQSREGSVTVWGMGDSTSEGRDRVVAPTSRSGWREGPASASHASDLSGSAAQARRGRTEHRPPVASERTDVPSVLKVKAPPPNFNTS